MTSSHIGLLKLKKIEFNLACSKMAAAYVLTKSVLNFVIFLVYLLCSSDLYTLNDISNVAESGSGLCLDSSTGNYCLWTNLVLGNVRYTTKKLFATTHLTAAAYCFITTRAAPLICQGLN